MSVIIDRDNYTIDDQGILKFKDGILTTGVINNEDKSSFVTINFNNIIEISDRCFQNCNQIIDLVIPGTVVSIGEGAFYAGNTWNESRSQLKTLRIEEGCQTIGNNCFRWNDKLEHVVLPSSITTMGSIVFWRCSLLKTAGPSNALNDYNYNYNWNDEIIQNAFYGLTGLTTITFSDTITNIGYNAFRECQALKDLIIPDTIKSIEDYAFYNCSFLTNLTMSCETSLLGLSIFSNVNNIKNIVFTKGINGKMIDYGVSNWSFNNQLRGSPQYNSRSSLESITMEPGIKKIGDRAFNSCVNLQKITIPASVVSMGSEVFSFCRSLNQIIIDPNNQNFEVIDNCLINKTNSNSKTIVFGNSMSTIPNDSEINMIESYAFYGQTQIIGEYEIPENITQIQDYAFYWCPGITNMSVPDTTNLQGNYVFGDKSAANSVYNLLYRENDTSSQKENTYGAQYRNIFYWAPILYESRYRRKIVKCDITATGSFTFPDSVTTVENNAFENCSLLTEIIMTGKVETIGENAFKGCSSLISMTLPFIGRHAYNTGLDDENAVFGALFGYVTVNKDEDHPTYDDSGHAISPNVYNPQINLYTFQYQNNSKWFYYEIPQTIKTVTILGGRDGITYIPQNAFYNCGEIAKNGINSGGFIENITIPESVTKIKTYSFYNCNKIKQIYIKNLSRWCQMEYEIYTDFYGNMRYSVLINQETEIYVNNLLLTELTTPSLINHVGIAVFENYSKLKKITLTNNIKYISENAFQNCFGLEDIYIEGALQSIGANAFRGCDQLQKINIQDINTWLNIDFGYSTRGGIPSLAYSNPLAYGNLYIDNKKITKLEIPNNAYKIKSNAFNGWKDLIEITNLGANVTSIGSYAFSGCLNLNKISFQDNVQNVDAGCFYNCENISWISVKNLKSWCSINFSISDKGTSSIFSNPIVYNKNLWIREENRSAINNSGLLTITNGIVEIVNGNFIECNNIKNIAFPASLEVIGSDVFRNCTQIQKINLPKKVYNIKQDAFYNVSKNLQQIIVENGNENFYTDDNNTMLIMKIDYNELKEVHQIILSCNKNEILNIPNNVWNIRSDAFVNCDKIKELHLENSQIREISNYAFLGCKNLKKIYFPAHPITLQENTFEDCPLNGIYIVSLNAWCSMIFAGSSPFNPLNIAKKIYLFNQNTQQYSEIKNLIIDGEEDLYGEITIINQHCFNNCESLETVKIKGNIEIINDSAFTNCPNLTSLQIEANCQEIGDYSFANCESLQNIELSNTVVKIGKHAFNNCDSLNNITLPNSIKSIGDEAFANCDNLSNIVLPNNLESLGGKILKNTAYYLDSDNWDQDFVLYNGSYLLEARNLYDSNGDIITVQQYQVRNGTKLISAETFLNNETVINIVLPEGLQRIGNRAFKNCINLFEIVIPNTVISLGEYEFHVANGTIVQDPSAVFEACTNLTTVVIPNNIDILWMGNFLDCKSLINLRVQNDDNSGINIPANITEIQKNVFENCQSIYTVKFVNGTERIRDYAFANCNGLRNLTFSKTIKSIGDYAFSNCSNLINLNIPGNINSLGENCFENCESLTNLTFYEIDNDTLLPIENEYNISTSLLDCCFQNCTGLVNLNISCSRIGIQAFAKCSNLKHVEILNGSTSKGIFSECNNLITLKLKTLNNTLGNLFSLTDVKTATYQGTYEVRTVDGTFWVNDLNNIPQTLTLVELIYPSSIPNRAFYNCSNVDIIIDYVEGAPKATIGSYAFKNCSAITNIVFPPNYETINEGAFSCCKNIESIEFYSGPSMFGRGLETIGNKAFEFCENLKSIIIPNTVTKIGESAFDYCKSLANITFKDNNYDPNNSTPSTIESGFHIYGSPQLKIIDKKAFKYCSSLSNFIIPNSVEEIREEAFAYCTSLTNDGVNGNFTIGVPPSNNNLQLKWIGLRAFYQTQLISEIKNYKGCQVLEHKYFSNCGDKEYQKDIIENFNQDLMICYSGLHFCNNLFDIFNYYEGEINGEGIYTNGSTLAGRKAVAIFSCEVGINQIENSDDSKKVTDSIKPIYKFTKQEIIQLLNGGAIDETQPEYVDWEFDNYAGTLATQIASTYLFANEIERKELTRANNSIFVKNSEDGNYYVRDSQGRCYIDCSTFIGLVLRGIPYQDRTINSPYVEYEGNSAMWTPSLYLETNYGTQGWEYKELDRQEKDVYEDISMENYSSIVSAADQAKFFNELVDNNGNKYGHLIYSARYKEALGNGTTTIYPLTVPTGQGIHNSIIQIIIDNRTTTDYTYNNNTESVEFNIAPEYGSKIVIIYSSEAPYFDTINQKAKYHDQNLSDKLRPGDLLFWSKPNGTTDQKSRYKSITHVAMVADNTNYYYQVIMQDESLDSGDTRDGAAPRNGIVKYLPFSTERLQYLTFIIRPNYSERISESFMLNKNLINYPPDWGYGSSSSFPDINDYDYELTWYTDLNDNRQIEYTIKGTKEVENNSSERHLKKDFYLNRGTYLVSLTEYENLDSQLKTFSANKSSNVLLGTSSLNGLVYVDGEWYYYTNGTINYDFVGLAKNDYNWWYIKNGTIDRTYTGMAQNSYGWWYIKNGQIDYTYTGPAQSSSGWMYVTYGKFDNTYSGAVWLSDNWWYMKNGKVDSTFTGMAYGSEGWLYFKKGKYDNTYNGTATNSSGTWQMKNGRIDLTVNSSSKNYLIYPLPEMNISQLYTGTTSHAPHNNSSANIKDYPIDDGGSSTAKTNWFCCPCDEIKITRIYGVGSNGVNTIWLQSTSKVYFANGSNDYVTIMVIHPDDSDLKKLSVGQKFKRKDKIFLEGTDGASAYHHHISVGKGTPTNNGWAQNSNEKWVLTTTGGTMKPENAFYIDTHFTTLYGNGKHGLTFKNLPASDAYYRVMHHCMNVTGTGYYLQDTNLKHGTVGTSINISSLKQSYGAFTFEGGKGDTKRVNEKPSFETTTTILANGTRVVNLFYSRKKYTFSTQKDSGIQTIKLIQPSTVNDFSSNQFYHGQSLLIEANLKNGFSWSKWKKDNTDYSTNQILRITAFNQNLSLTATSVQNSYSISYNLNGGYLASENPISYNSSTPSFTLSNPSRDGYVFTGWTGTDLTSPTINVTISTGSTGNKNYIANWQPEQIENVETTFKVNHYLQNVDRTYSKDSGRTTVNTSFVGTVVTLSNYKINYVNFNYDCGKGGTSENLNRPTTPDLTTTILADGQRVINLYYSRKTYNLTLKSSEGIITTTGQGSHLYGQQISITATLDNDYQWQGWYQDGNLYSSQQTILLTMPGQNLELEGRAIYIPNIPDPEQEMNIDDFNIHVTNYNGTEVVPLVSQDLNKTIAFYDQPAIFTVEELSKFNFGIYIGNRKMEYSEHINPTVKKISQSLLTKQQAENYLNL